MPAPNPFSFNLQRLRAELKPFRLHFFPTLRSTNDHAAALRKRGDLFAPAVVLTGRQTAGRGRGANTWFSSAGSLTVTFVLPVDATLAPHHLPLAAGLAARNAAAEIAGNDQILLKWPNDLVFISKSSTLKFQKLAGLLCERIDNVDLIGIGLNVNRPRRSVPKDLRDRVIFLEQIRNPQSTIGNPVDLTTALITLARHIHATLLRNADAPFPTLLREYDHHHALIGRRVTVLYSTHPPITGTCQGLDHTGRLLIKDRRATHRVIAGHVELI